MTFNKLTIITFATDVNKLEYLKKSANLFNVEIHYIINKTWNGYYSKITETNNLLSKMNDQDLVLFIDAYDVIVNSFYDEILTKFYEYGCDILLSSELNCFPDIYKEKLDNINENNETNYRYINSGGYIGYVKDIKKIFKWKDQNEILKICEKGSDQAYFIEFFLENYNKINIKIDYKSIIFQCMHLVSWDEIVFHKGRMYNNILEVYPCFIHFNGGSWQMDDLSNIMPIFLDKVKESKNNQDKLKLNSYKQIITKTCYPVIQK